MKTKIIFTTVLSSILLLSSCSKEQGITPSNNINSEITPSQLKIGGDKNGRFSSNDCTESKIGCAAEVTIDGNKKSELFGLSPNPVDNSDYFGNNEEYYEGVFESDILEMFLNGSAFLKHLTSNNEVDYFGVVATESNTEIYVLPIK